MATLSLEETAEAIHPYVLVGSLSIILFNTLLSPTTRLNISRNPEPGFSNTDDEAQSPLDESVPREDTVPTPPSAITVVGVRDNDCENGDQQLGRVPNTRRHKKWMVRAQTDEQRNDDLTTGSEAVRQSSDNRDQLTSNQEIDIQSAAAYTKATWKSQTTANRKRSTCDSTACTDPTKSQATARSPQDPRAGVSLDVEGSSAQLLVSAIVFTEKKLRRGMEAEGKGYRRVVQSGEVGIHWRKAISRAICRA